MARTAGDALVTRSERRAARALMSWSRGEALLRAIVLYPAMCTVLTLTAYTVHGMILAPLRGQSLYGDYILQSSPGWPRFVVPQGIYWFGIVPVLLVTVLWLLGRPAQHLPDTSLLVIFLVLDVVMTLVISGSFLDLEEWPHDLWIAAIPMAVCAVVVMVVAARRRRRQRERRP